jgi:hypothetical protein
MDQIVIIDKVKKIKEAYYYDKSAGRDFLTKLTNEFLSYGLSERKSIIDFFLGELQFDTNGLRWLVVPLLSEMKATEAASSIYEIFLNVLKDLGSHWERIVVTALMGLRYSEPKQFYSDYIEAQQSIGEVYWLRILYCKVDPVGGLENLSNFIVDQLMNSYKSIEFMPIGVLVARFSKEPKDYTVDLLFLLTRKNEMIGLLFKEMLLDYYHSELKIEPQNEYYIKMVKILHEIYN